MKLVTKRRPKPKIKLKNKSYELKDSALYNLRTKRKLIALLGCSQQKLKALSEDSNYHVFNLVKEGKKPREIQAPNFVLNMIQTRIASLLVRVATPEYLYSGIKGRSNISNAKVHVGNHPVLTMDIKNFYPSITKKSIYNFFYSTMNAASDVAGILAEVCSYNNHIPTGSRISMPLSFWTNYKIYSDLNTLCIRESINMSIFVDDLSFSGVNVDKLFQLKVKKIIESGGLIVHPKKTRLYHKDKPKLITGVIVGKDDIKVRREHHKAIYTLFSELGKCKDEKEFNIMQKKLLGHLNAAGQIESKFKNRAKQFRCENKKF
jgi:retron-type reverse transcriptase